MDIICASSNITTIHRQLTLCLRTTSLTDVNVLSVSHATRCNNWLYPRLLLHALDFHLHRGVFLLVVGNLLFQFGDPRLLFLTRRRRTHPISLLALLFPPQRQFHLGHVLGRWRFILLLEMTHCNTIAGRG